jgi:uncharacterized protein (DUF362 family)
MRWLAFTQTGGGSSSVHDVHVYLNALATQALPKGGWGYDPGQPVHLEPTCLALVALAQDRVRYQTALEQGQAALRRHVGPDGACRLARGREEAVWPTALVLFVQATLGVAADELEHTAARLLSVRGRSPDDKQAEVHDIDLKLEGWPWAEGNFSWACLALRRANYGSHSRVAEGLQLLLDRTADEGGINYGNRRILGRKTEPIPGPTALMLLALQGHVEDPRVAASVAYLRQQASISDDLEHLCWAKLSLDLYREQPGVNDLLTKLDERIVAAAQNRATMSWLRPAIIREALTALALATEQGNPFRLPASEPADRASERSPCSVPSNQCVLRPRPWQDRLASAFRGMAIEAVGRMRQLPPRSVVHIAPANDYNADLADVLKRQYEPLRNRVPLAGKRVVLKPNLVEYHRDKVINTHPHVVAAAIELCRREGAAEVIVAEGPGHWRNVEYLVNASGLGDVLRHYQVPFIDLNHDEPVKTPNLGRLTGLEYLYLAQTVASAEVLISLPKLKTHHWAGATLALKNLFGTLPGICYGWPKNELHWRGIDNSIVDIALTRKPDLAIVDGIVGMEGDGPLNGSAKPFGAVIMGTDPLAVDATCCRLMQLDPERLAYLALGYRKKLGLLREAEIEQHGETIAGRAQPFALVPPFERLSLNRSA